MNTQQISTAYWAKPIPTRSHDWQATFGDYDAGDPMGFGATEMEAIDDLNAQIEDVPVSQFLGYDAEGMARYVTRAL
jgi:hypothetical protein